MRWNFGIKLSARFFARCSVVAAVFLGLVSSAAADEKLYFKFKDGGTQPFYARSYALVIGISDYPEILRPLPGADRDAENVADALRNAGFDEVKTHYAQTITGKGLRELIAEFVDSYGYEEDSRVLIWFAGHGFTIDGEGYLVGSDAKKPDVASPESLKAFYKASMPMRLFGVYLRQMRARHVLLVLDSCFSGSVFSNTRSIGRGPSTIEMYNPTRQIITSGKEGQEVSDEGRFADMFVRAISGETDHNGRSADQDEDGYINGTELHSFLYANARSNLQTPQLGRLPSFKTLAGQSDTLVMTAYANYELGEFFFPLSESLKSEQQVPETRAVEADRSTIRAVVWSGLEKGARIANNTLDPIPVFDASPPALGEKVLDLEAGSFYPPANHEAIIEKAEIEGKTWLRFDHNGSIFYMPAGEVTIQRP